MGDEDFLNGVVERVRVLPGVVGVALGGSRAQGRATPDSDWDLGVFVDEDFTVAAVRASAAAAGWTGHVADLGEWGPVMNGGAWLTVEGRRVDLLWRPVATVERLVGEAEAGEFSVVRIPFFLAGIASYVPVGELSVNQPLAGTVPEGIPMPPALRTRAAAWWRDNARFDLDHARSQRTREPVIAAALLTRVLLELAHARRCDRGAWVLNEKHLLHDAGLDDAAALVAAALTDATALDRALDHVGSLR